MSRNTRFLISVVGPTAVGKTSFGIELAQAFKTEILSVDSRQFYREMEIGTAKPTQEERQQVKHHFVDNLSIYDSYNVGDFEAEALTLLEGLFEKLNLVVAVGGSGLFCKALWEGLDDMPQVKRGIREELNAEFEKRGLNPLVVELEMADPVYFQQVDLQNHQRVIRALEVIRSTGEPFSKFRMNKPAQSRDFQNIKIGLTLGREILFERINHRMDLMIENGLFEEAQKLYPHKNLNALQTVGYREIFDHFDGKYDRDEAVRLLKRNSRRYAKRQMTWFKKDPEIEWVLPEDLLKVIKKVSEQIKV